jgi:hypothetical protein
MTPDNTVRALSNASSRLSMDSSTDECQPCAPHRNEATDPQTVTTCPWVRMAERHRWTVLCAY